MRNAEAGNPKGVAKVFRNLPSVVEPELAQEIIAEWQQALLDSHQARRTERRPDDAYDDVQVVVTLAPLKSPYLSMTVDLTLTTKALRWIVGVTTDELVADQVCALTTLVNEMICPGPTEEQRQAASFSLYGHDLKKRRVRAIEISMENVESGELARLVGDDLFSDFPDVKWFIGDVAGHDNGVELHRLTFHNTHPIDYRARYCFWSAGRDMYVRSILLDARAFPGIKVHRFSLQPFLSVPIRSSGPQRLGYFELEVDNWIDAGNGIAFVWGDPG